MQFFRYITIILTVLPLISLGQNSILDHKDKIVIEKINAVNSLSRETNLSISPDGKYLYFMSSRGGQMWSSYQGQYDGVTRYDGDIYYSQKVGNKWERAKCLGLGVNTFSGEDEPMISPDGQFVVFQSWKYNWKVTGGPYYKAERTGATFTNSKGLGSGINQFFLTEYIKTGGSCATDGASISADGNTFLVCYGPTYTGKMDIYISRKENGIWSYLKKLDISTAGDERSVFIAGDGKTVYFASDGYQGLGGLDVYKTVLNDDGTCGEVINIGAPFNTNRDDYGFITTATGDESYFVREGDIYYANTKEADPNLKPTITILISGTIKDEDGKPVQLYLELEDGNNAKKISTSKSNSESGEFLFSTANVSGTYRIRDDNHKYVDTSFTLVFKEGTGEYHLNLVIKKNKPPVTNSKKIMVNFEHDRDILDADDKKMLDEIIILASQSIEYTIEIKGHTDANGTVEYNKKLGLERAESMKNYLTLKGLDPKKISTTSYGEGQLLEDEKHRAAAQRNRRAELILNYTK